MLNDLHKPTFQLDSDANTIQYESKNNEKTRYDREAKNNNF